MECLTDHPYHPLSGFCTYSYKLVFTKSVTLIEWRHSLAGLYFSTDELSWLFFLLFSCQIRTHVKEAARESGGRGSIPSRNQQPGSRTCSGRRWWRWTERDAGRSKHDAAGFIRFRRADAFIDGTCLWRVSIFDSSRLYRENVLHPSALNWTVINYQSAITMLINYL